VRQNNESVQGRWILCQQPVDFRGWSNEDIEYEPQCRGPKDVWKFEMCAQMKTIILVLSFPVNVQAIDWKEYVNVYVTGIRKYILKDDLSSLSRAQKKLSM
jgi:hypothetical protein